MRVLRTPKQKSRTKLVMSVLAIASVATLISGGILMNPILLGAGIAGLFLSCGAVVAVRRPQPMGLV
jgi:hypothetical protein